MLAEDGLLQDDAMEEVAGFDEPGETPGDEAEEVGEDDEKETPTPGAAINDAPTEDDDDVEVSSDPSSSAEEDE